MLIFSDPRLFRTSLMQICSCGNYTFRNLQDLNLSLPLQILLIAQQVIHKRGTWQTLYSWPEQLLIRIAEAVHVGVDSS